MNVIAIIMPASRTGISGLHNLMAHRRTQYAVPSLISNNAAMVGHMIWPVSSFSLYSTGSQKWKLIVINVGQSLHKVASKCLLVEMRTINHVRRDVQP